MTTLMSKIVRYSVRFLKEFSWCL